MPHETEVVDGFQDAAAPAEARNVYVYIYVKRIAAINTVTQDFEIAFYRYMMWEPTQEEKAGFEADPDAYTPTWVPNLILVNQKSLILQEENKGGKANLFHMFQDGGVNVWGERCTFPDNVKNLFGVAHEITAVCAESFGLQNFPFDVQDFTLIFESDMSNEFIRICPNCVGFGGAKPATVIAEDDGGVPEWSFQMPVVEQTPSAWGSDRLVIMFKAARNYQKHVFVTGTTIAIITGLSLALYAIPISDTADRVSNMFTLLLTLVAFQFVVSSSIPSLPYTTLMDKYVLVSFIFIGLVCVQTVVFSTFDSLHDHDGTAFYVAIGIYLLIHAVTAVWSVVARAQEKLKLARGFVGDTDDASKVFFVESDSCSKRSDFK